MLLNIRKKENYIHFYKPGYLLKLYATQNA
jgi:hypothetical protein